MLYDLGRYIGINWYYFLILFIVMNFIRNIAYRFRLDDNMNILKLTTEELIVLLNRETELTFQIKRLLRKLDRCQQNCHICEEYLLRKKLLSRTQSKKNSMLRQKTLDSLSKVVEALEN